MKQPFGGSETEEKRFRTCIAKYIFSTLGLVEIIDIPMLLTVMLCSDSEVTCGLGVSFTRLNHDRTTHGNPLHSASAFSCLCPMYT